MALVGEKAVPEYNGSKYRTAVSNRLVGVTDDVEFLVAVFDAEQEFLMASASVRAAETFTAWKTTGARVNGLFFFRSTCGTRPGVVAPIHWILAAPTAPASGCWRASNDPSAAPAPTSVCSYIDEDSMTFSGFSTSAPS